MHHTWKERFKIALKNKNWKKIISHEILEYSILGGIILALGVSIPAIIAGLIIVFFIHMFVFEAVDALHKKDTKIHKYIPKWLHWLFDHDHT